MSRVEGYAHKRIAQRFSRTLAAPALPSPMISFTFDDFPRSALTVAGATLAEKGLRGTYYASLGLMGQRSSVGEIFSIDDLRLLVQEGHELACHTFDHVACGRLSPRELQEQCERNRAAAAEALGGYALRNFSFPSGSVTLAGKQAAARGYETCRTTDQGINSGVVDLAYLLAIPVYSSRPLRELERIVADNVKRKGWAILYTHDVAPRPSPFGCTPQYFREVLSIAIASGADILTVARAVRRFAIVGQ